MFDSTGFIIGIILFAVFVGGFLGFLILKGTPKFDEFTAKIKSKFKKG